MKLAITLMIDLLILCALIAYFVIKAPNKVQITGTYLNMPYEIKDFKLVDTKDQIIGKKQLKDHWTFIFFGFTRCPQVCPTTLSALKNMYESLKTTLKPEQMPQIIFISVDPDQDNAKRIKHFLQQFNSDFIGLRGNQNEVLNIAKSLHLIVNDSQPRNHSTEIVLLNADAKVQALFSYPQTGEKLAQDYTTILAVSK